MSETIFRVVIRGHIPELDGKDYNEVYETFKFILGRDADEVDKYNDSIEYFLYAPFPNTLTPICSYNPMRWGLQQILTSGWDDNCNMKLENLLDIKNRMQKLFPSTNNITISAYNWCSAVDEPITFEGV